MAQEVLLSIRKTGTYALADHGRETMLLPMNIAAAEPWLQQKTVAFGVDYPR